MFVSFGKKARNEGTMSNKNPARNVTGSYKYNYLED